MISTNQSNQEPESLYGRGKGNANDGCTLCGSKFHRPPDCPLNKGKGASKGKKGKTKGYGRKGGSRKGEKGKGKMKRKSRGYWTDDDWTTHSEWQPEFSWDSWHFTGFTLKPGLFAQSDHTEQSPPRISARKISLPTSVSPTPQRADQDLEQQYAAPNIRSSTSSSLPPVAIFPRIIELPDSISTSSTVVVGEPTTSYELSPQRPDAHTSHMSQESNASTTTATGFGGNQKKSIFQQKFMVNDNTDGSYLQMHSVRGKSMHGLIVDSGASSGLMGTDTFRKYLQEVLQPAGKTVKFEPTSNTFTGVDGLTDPGLALCTMPLGVPGEDGISFKADLIGNAGSTCPGLLPLPTLIYYYASLFCNILEHNDGVLVLILTDGKQQSRTIFIHVYFTDSGHYLLPIGSFNQKNPEDQYLKDAVWKYCDRFSVVLKNLAKDNLKLSYRPPQGREAVLNIVLSAPMYSHSFYLSLP